MRTAGGKEGQISNRRKAAKQNPNKLSLESLGIWLLYLSVTLELLIVIVDKSNYTNPIEGQLFRITFLLAAAKVLMTRYSRKEWIALILFGILGLISYRATGRNEILRIVAFVAACKGVEMEKVLKYVFYTTLGGCLLLILLSVTGIYGELALEADFGRGYVQTRYCLGLGHPNALHCMFLMLVLLGLYLYSNRMRWYGYAALAGLNYALFLLTDSKTGVMLTFCGILGAVLVHYVKGLEERRWIYAVVFILLIVCVGFSILAADSRFARPEEYWFANPLIAEAETHLNGRIQDLYYGSVNREGTTATWSLFSGPENDYYFDMGFVRLFYWYGILPGTVYVLCNLWLIRQFYKTGNGMGLVMLAVLSVYTVVEAHIISVYIGRNYLLFLLGMYAGRWGCRGAEAGSLGQEYLWRSYRLIGKWSRNETDE